MSTSADNSVTCIALERPSSVRKLFANLDKSWLVDTYFVGPENESLLYLFDEARIDQLCSLSPVVFYGEKSLGKTALAVTLAVRWSKLTVLRPLVFTTGEAFGKDFVAAVEIDDVSSFRGKHRDCKMLVLDDFDSLATKPAAQDELIGTLDVLADANIPVIVTCSQLPAALKGIKSALASRLSAGLSIQLARPTRSTRAVLVESLVDKIDPLIDANVLNQVADQLPGAPLSPLEICDLVKIAHQMRGSNAELQPAVISAMMRQHLSGATPDVAAITKTVCRRLHVRLLDVRGTSREANIVRARSVAIYLARKLTSLSLLQIGEYFSGRDHSTILHAIRKITASVDSDVELANLCREVEAELLA